MRCINGPRLKRVFPTITVTLVLTTGCAQMTRHSNTLVFSTNTNFGLKAGQDASQTPMVNIGYDRQEVAFVPVYANTGVSDNGGRLKPCPESESASCHFRATYNGIDKDSYSVLASFGGASGTDPDTAGIGANVVIAQYFATGVAAQKLALSGGANVVQAGGDTGAKAAAAKSAAERNAEKESTLIDLGEKKAREILKVDGNDPVPSESIKRLSEQIGVNGCNEEILKRFRQTSVDEFINDVRERRFQCLAILARQ